jgi:hypothetical protein
MTEKVLTIRMSEHEHRALKLYAVLQGRSVNAVVTDLIRAELGRQAPAESGGIREGFVAELLARFGIDPDSPEHRAAVERARATIQRAGDSRTGKGAA